MAKLEAELAAALEREKRFGEVIAQQQTLIGAQQELIADLRKQLAAADAERAATVARLEREVARLERELIGPKTERVKVPPIGLELSEEMTEQERARRREEAAAKRREHALAKNAILETEEVTHEVSDVDL
jgi:multidrug efflux pump subunit AcrA (membrane-fusion protein)